jgi:ABC-2 type transport system permease protein
MILANLGLGIFISAISKTQQQAMLAAIIIILPTMLLSGLLFAIRNMPPFFQGLTYLIPMRYFLVIVRGIFLKGSGFLELWPQVLALLVFSAAIFALAVSRFKKREG